MVVPPNTAGPGGIGIDSETAFTSGANEWISQEYYYNIYYWAYSADTTFLIAYNDPLAVNTFYVFGIASSGSLSWDYVYGSGVYYNITSTASFPSSFYIIPASTDGEQVVYWVRIRAYPPNGVMPSFSVIQLLTPTISVNTSTNFQFNVSISDIFSEYVNYTVYLNGSILTTNNVTVTAFQTLTIPYTYQYLFNQSGTYNLTVVAYGQTSGVTAIATDIFSIQLDQLNVSMSPVPYVYNLSLIHI